jgi:hypothetical protein
LAIDALTGVLSGTPTSTGTFNVSVTAANAATAVTRNFTLFSFQLNQSAVLTGLPTDRLGDFVVGSNVSTALVGAPGGTPPYTITLVGPSPLPPGLAIVPADKYPATSNFGRWAIAGIPTAAGFYSFRLRYADSSGLAEERPVSMNITTLALAATTPSWARVNTFYSAQLYGVGGSGAYTFALADVANNVLPPGMSLSLSGLLSGIPLATGSQGFTVLLSSNGASRRIGVTLNVWATSDNRRLDLSFGPVLSEAVVGRAYVTSLFPSSGAGTHAWTVASGALPPGMRLLTGSSLPPGFAPPTAVLAGAPSAPGTYSFALRVDDSTGLFAIRHATLVVSRLRGGPINRPLDFATVLPPAQLGSAYSFSLTGLTGTAPYTFATTTGTFLPTGMSLNSGGVLSGTPADAGNFTLNMLVTDAIGSTRRASLGLTVYPAGRPIGLGGFSFVNFPNATRNLPYSVALDDLINPGFGAKPYAWTLDSGALPPGILLAPGSGPKSAVLAGTPTTTGNYSLSLLAPTPTA